MSVSDSTYWAIFGDGTSVLERVLLAIINAHTTRATEGLQAERLQAAMTALIGPAARDGQDMERALLFMRRHRQRDVCDVEMQALRSCAGSTTCATRTVSELATLAACEVLGCTTAGEVEVTARVLCETFCKRGSPYEVALDHVQEVLEAEAVQRFCDELAEWGVPTRL
ncbi:hypothetical protein WHT83_08875 [Aminobacter sp. P9b]|uniref:hypothetical protein n=1 Tax=Aminobacter sp. P9b TaxID=3133697 RepID=UPI0032508F96